MGGFLWEGDGTRYGQTYVKNTHQSLPIRIELGQELGETNVISGVATGSADSRTGEVFHLDDDATKQVVKGTSNILVYCTAVNPYIIVVHKLISESLIAG